jgi:hypothetical protein
MKNLLAAVVTLLLVLVPIELGHSQTEWPITPGKGWGPLYLGMSEDDAIQAIGKQPKKRLSKTTVFHAIYYDTVTLVFNGRGGLARIEIRNRMAQTREGIRIGALLSDVIRVYGDSKDNQHFVQSVANIVNCLKASVIDEPETAHRTTLALEYFDRGIEFDFWSIASGPTFREPIAVDEIDVVQPHERSECPPL